MTPTRPLVRMMRRLPLFAFFAMAFATGSMARAQSISPEDMDKLHIMEDSMTTTADSMYEAFIPDTHIFYSDRLIRQLVRTLKIPNSYSYPFDKLGKYINIIAPDDKAFRIFNWEVTMSNIMKHYVGAIQMPQSSLKLYPLFDYTEQMGKGAEDSILTNGKWFGALYYNITPIEFQGKKIYTLYGLNTTGAISNKKVLDPLYVDEKGIIFGAPVFGVASTNYPRQRINRFILEYKKDVQATLHWDKDRKMIVFDKLVSQVNDPSRKYTYVPSGQYDGLRWSDDTWNYVRDLVPVQVLQDGQQPDEAK
jgi:hypothetical protein